eukprot:2808192-Prymnesium_polylepis.1
MHHAGDSPPRPPGMRQMANASQSAHFLQRHSSARVIVRSYLLSLSSCASRSPLARSPTRAKALSGLVSRRRPGGCNACVGVGCWSGLLGERPSAAWRRNAPQPRSEGRGRPSDTPAPPVPAARAHSHRNARWAPLTHRHFWHTTHRHLWHTTHRHLWAGGLWTH